MQIRLIQPVNLLLYRAVFANPFADITVQHRVAEAEVLFIGEAGKTVFGGFFGFGFLSVVIWLMVGILSCFGEGGKRGD